MPVAVISRHPELPNQIVTALDGRPRRTVAPGGPPMPSKGKRVAVSQSNQRRRRRSGPGRPATAPSPASGAGAATATATAPSATATATAPSASPTARPTPAQAPPASQPRGRRFERPAAYNHVGSELARIGIFSAVLLAALIAISFVI